MVGFIPLFLITLFIYLLFFYVPDSSCKEVFYNDTKIEIPASAKIVYKDHTIQIWTDYDEAFIMKMKSEDYEKLLKRFQEDSVFRLNKELHIGITGHELLKKAEMNKNHFTWYEKPGTHHKHIGFHANEQLVIYGRYRY